MKGRMTIEDKREVTIKKDDLLSKICPLFACVHATNSGHCSIKGWLCKQGEKEYCPIFNAMCVYARCEVCGREGLEECKKVTR